jgi:hypothetical protein
MIPNSGFDKGANGENMLAFFTGPSHTATTHPLLDDRFGGGLYRTTADWQAALYKRWIIHQPLITLEESDSGIDRFPLAL